jgi:hypothetical protein
MATRQDFSDEEWAALQRGLTGSGMLVSISDRDFTDSFGEAGALGKFLAGQQVAGATDLIREVSKTHGTGFGLTSSQDEVRGQTLESLRSSVALLQAKHPDEVEPYRALVIGVAEAVADAKGGGTSEIEAAAIAQIREALGASA